MNQEIIKSLEKLVEEIVRNIQIKDELERRDIELEEREHASTMIIQFFLGFIVGVVVSAFVHSFF